jgi:predicted dehydrogenase
MRLGKHVYCEKPLTWSIAEARRMAETARQHKVATQMGTQGMAENGARAGIEVLRSGAIGPVREMHVWTDRAQRWWPQGVDRPTENPPVPGGLDWDLWIGTAPLRPYHPAYVPFAWRGWLDFGTGAIGDMGIHNAAMAWVGLELGLPQSAEVVATSGINYQPPAPSVARVSSHHAEWVAACKGQRAALCNFIDFGAPLTEVMLLGNLALRTGQKIDWDAAAMQAKGNPAADELIRREYRKGWEM